MKARLKEMAEGPPIPPPPPPKMNHGVVAAVLMVTVLALAFPAGVTFYCRRIRKPGANQAEARDPLAYLYEDDPSLAAFFSTLWTGPSTPSANAVPGLAGHAPLPGEELVEGETGLEIIPPDQLPEALPIRIAKMRYFLAEASRANGADSRQKMFAELARQLRSVEKSCTAPQWLPLWQLASAVERLVRQLAKKPDHATPSCFKTVAGGIDLLRVLA